MSDKFHYLNSENNFHGDKNMTTKDFENLRLYEKSRMSRPRQKNKKHKTIFSEIKTLKKEEN